jgi:hypothetical protein
MVGAILGTEKTLVIVVSAISIFGYITAQMRTSKSRLLHTLMLMVSLILMLLLHLTMQKGIQHRLDQDCAEHIGACMLRAKLAIAESDVITLRQVTQYLAERGLQDNALMRMQAILALWESNHLPIQEWIDLYPDDIEMMKYYIRFLEDSSQHDLAVHYNQLLVE